MYVYSGTEEKVLLKLTQSPSLGIPADECRRGRREPDPTHSTVESSARSPGSSR